MAPATAPAMGYSGDTYFADPNCIPFDATCNLSTVTAPPAPAQPPAPAATATPPSDNPAAPEACENGENLAVGNADTVERRAQELCADLTAIEESGLPYMPTEAEQVMSFNRYAATLLGFASPLVAVFCGVSKAGLSWLADKTTPYADFQSRYLNRYVTDYRDDPFPPEAPRSYVNYDASGEGVRQAESNLTD